MKTVMTVSKNAKMQLGLGLRADDDEPLPYNHDKTDREPIVFCD
jgi:hypothetical protein